MKTFLFVALAATFLWVSCETRPPRHPGDGNILMGKWAYRSLRNNPNLNIHFDTLEFAAATVELQHRGKDSLVGQILWVMDSTPLIYNGLNLSGYYYYSDTTLCYFLEGFGDSTLGTAGWQYNSQGYLVPPWLEGVDQAKVLVGSTIRVKKHSCDSTGRHCSPAGVVASIYMVKE